MLAALAVATSSLLVPTPLAGGAASVATPRATASMGLFDAFSNAFANKDYSNSPATYEQTNARASHILVADEAQCQKIKDDIAAGSIDFAGAAMQYSTCNSAQQGGKLGKFVPGTMVKEFDDVVFGVFDTGSVNLGNGADLFAPKYEMNNEDGTPITHGPVKTKFGYHLIQIQTRNLAEFDFRQKMGINPSGQDSRTA